MNKIESHAGFCITNVKLQVTEIVKKDDQYCLSNLDEVYFNQEIDFAKDKETKIISLLQTAFEELIIKNSITSNSVSFSLPQELFITASLPIENSLLNTDLIEEFRWQLSILYPFLNWNDYVIRYYEVDEKHVASNNTALVFALNRKYMKIISDFCSKNNLKLKYIDHIHLTSNDILAMSSVENSEKIISFYISPKIISMLISVGGKPIFYEDIPIKSGHEIRSIIESKLNELKKHPVYFSEAYLFGEIISKSIAETLSETTGINFILANPFTKLDVDNTLLTNKFYSETNYLFISSAGTAVRI